MVNTQWFVECDPFSNESLAELLAAWNIGKDAEYRGVLDNLGVSRDVWLVPPELVTRLRHAMVVQPTLKFRFFKRDGSSGVIRSADFLMKRRKSAVLKRAADDLATVTARKKAR